MLVGWYLLVPKPHKPEQPLNQWSQTGAFDTAKQYGDKRTEALKFVGREDYTGIPGKFSVEDDRTALGDSKCIATDDPRLKGN